MSSRLILIVVAGWLAAPVLAADLPPVKVFVLAGQSNMEGQAVVDLSGQDYNGGKHHFGPELQFGHVMGDALTGTLRDSGGNGVHFSGEGLRVHGAKWAEKISPWLEAQLSASPSKP